MTIILPIKECLNITKDQLHIVNGTAAISALKNNGIGGEFMEWLDVLHDGPLGPTNSRSDFLHLRAKFIGEAGWEKTKLARQRLEDRDNKLLNWKGEIIIWNSFEMFDQLQLMDILNCTDRKDFFFIFVEDYLSNITKGNAALEQKKQNPKEAFKLIKQIWSATCEQNIELLEHFLELDLSDWPFLKAGLQRYILELPDNQGINQTDRLILDELNAGPLAFDELFRRVQAREKIRFMGDLSFWLRINSLANSHIPRLSIKKNNDTAKSEIELLLFRINS